MIIPDPTAHLRWKLCDVETGEELGAAETFDAAMLAKEVLSHEERINIAIELDQEAL